METTYTQGYLEGYSVSSCCVEDIITGKYDLGILTSSWDSRCVCVCDANYVQFDNIILTLFEVRDSMGLRDEHDKVLTEFSVSKCKHVSYISGFSVDVYNMWKKLLTDITRVRKELRRPLRIFMDLSACPRFYALALVGSCLSYGIAESISLLYAEGIYSSCSLDSVTSMEYLFSKGHWRIVPIPAFEGRFDPEKKKYYLVSVGFEGPKTLQVINREDPDSISVLFPEPAVIPEYAEVAKLANEELIQSYKVDESQIIRVHAGDAIAAWKALDNASLEKPEDNNVFYLCSGTKPHALGLALRAMILEYPIVLYRIPENHNPIIVKPTGQYWRFDIKDLTSLDASGD